MRRKVSPVEPSKDAKATREYNIDVGKGHPVSIRSLGTEDRG